MNILAINPGSTSTKFAVFSDNQPVLLRSIRHTAQQLKQFDQVIDQLQFRRQLIEDELHHAHVPFNFQAVIGRGGLSRPVKGGVYEVNELMLSDARNAIHQHACDLGCLIAHEIASEIPGCRCLIADPGVTDELNDYARICGSPLMRRICIWHALNQRAIARRFAAEVGRRYEDLNLIICHLGGGISVAAHDHGRAVDANNALDGEGPFSPERAGTLPAADLIRLCFSGKFTQKQLLARVAGHAGLVAHLGTNDMTEIVQRINQGDDHARLIVDAMIYHVAKAITAQAAVLFGKVDAILLTGGMAHNDYVISRLRPRIDFLAPTYCFPGEDELEALAQNALLALTGQTPVNVYGE